MSKLAVGVCARLLPVLIVGAVSACLSTESGNPADAQSVSGPNIGSAAGTSLPSPDGTPTPGASASVMPSTTATATAMATATATATATAMASATATDAAEAPCEFSAAADAGANDAGALFYRCTVVDGGVSCTCGTEQVSAESDLQDGQVLPAGEACNSALAEQCGRAFP